MRQAKDMPVRHVVVAIMLAVGSFVGSASLASADGSGDPTAVKNEGGKYYDKEGNPTFKVQSDGTVDWFTYSGFRRYHSDCHVCHGPDGEGSSYAPALSNSLKTMNYPDFANVVVNGRKNVNTAQESVMPSFGTNPNVMCYLDDIFVYLRARTNDAVPRGRPQKHEDKPEAATQVENSCLGHTKRKPGATDIQHQEPAGTDPRASAAGPKRKRLRAWLNFRNERRLLLTSGAARGNGLRRS
jgi:methanol metabolism-related c-type cytochrome